MNLNQLQIKQPVSLLKKLTSLISLLFFACAVQAQAQTTLNTDLSGSTVEQKNVEMPTVETADQSDFDQTKIIGGVINTAGKIKIDIFPNPAHDLLTVIIHVKEATLANVKIFDLFGNDTGIGAAELIDIDGSVELDISPLVPGTFMVKVNADTKTVSKSFLKI